MLNLFKNKIKGSIKKFIDFARFHLSRSRKNRIILLSSIPAVGILGLVLIIVNYHRTLKKTKTFFRTQFEEKVESDISMANSWFINYTNSLDNDIKKQFSNLGSAINLRSYILRRSNIIQTKYKGSIKEVIFVNYKTGKCEILYPVAKRGSYKYLYGITDRSNLVINKSLSKNFIYVYFPNTKTEQVDSTIWGVICQAVKINKKVIGRILFVIDVPGIIGQKVSLNSSGSGNTYKLSLVPLREYEKLKEEINKRERRARRTILDHYVRWDNAVLELQFVKNPEFEIPWITRYKTVKKYILYYTLIFGLLGFTAFTITVFLFVRIGSEQQEEMNKLLKQSDFLEFMIDRLKNNIQIVSGEELIITGLKILIGEKDISIHVCKGDELIFSWNGGEEHIEKCPGKCKKSMNKLCEEIQIGGDRYRIHLEFNDYIDEKESVFYTILVNVLAFAANFSNEYQVRRSIESNTFKSILKLLGAKDHYTCDHSVSVAEIAKFIAEELRKTNNVKFDLREYDIDVIKMAGYLHDIGKMGIPDEILNKLGRYNEAEMDIMRLHPKFTEMIIKPLAEYVDFYKDVLDVAVHHHERLDGSGYPYGLKGAEFTIKMQILAISDILDAMMRDRPYKQAKGDEEVIEELRAMISGPENSWKFDPELIEIVIAKFHEIKQIPYKIDKDFCEIDIQ